MLLGIFWNGVYDKGSMLLGIFWTGVYNFNQYNLGGHALLEIMCVLCTIKN